MKGIADLRRIRPQLDLDGTSNVWILKPAFGSKGRGIQLVRGASGLRQVSKLPGAADRPALLVELPSADGCVALNDSETLASLRSDPTMTADAMAHLTALQGEISKVMKTLQTAK